MEAVNLKGGHLASALSLEPACQNDSMSPTIGLCLTVYVYTTRDMYMYELFMCTYDWLLCVQ